MAEFTEEFNVESSNRAYKDFIEKLRTKLGQRSSHNRPVLPVQEDPPTRWFDIVLRTNAHAIRLRFRLGNLYLDGYQMENPQQWLEFGNTNSHLIPGSNSLGFNGGYTDLANVANLMMEDIPLGQQPLMNAVNQLATTTNRQNRAKSLIVVIQMICESIRFIPISNELTSKFRDGLKISLWMLELERNWGDLSAALLRADAYPNESFQLPPNILQIPPIPPDDKRIRTLADAAEVLGILLGLIFKPSGSG